MTCLLSKYPVKYVKKILQKLQIFTLKTAIIFFIYDGCYVFNFIIFNYLIFKSENVFLFFPVAFLCFPMIFYSSSCTFIQIYYSCFFTHFNNIFKYVVSVQYVYSFFIFSSGYIFSVSFFIWISSTGLLSIIIKAYSMGFSNCTTTNILIRWFYCVHWIKPPFRKFPINDISPTYEIFFHPW